MNLRDRARARMLGKLVRINDRSNHADTAQ